MVVAVWFEDLFSTFTDATFYFVLAAVGTALFTIRLALMLFTGFDGSSDFDHDMGTDGGLEAHGGDFSLFSMISILSFMMGAGWLGLAARLDWKLGPVPAALYASLFGFALMALCSLALWQMRKLSQPSSWSPKHAQGHVGTAYLRIPAGGQGRGQVQVVVDGTSRTLDAVTEGDAIESFASVRVKGVREDGVLIVERA